MLKDAVGAPQGTVIQLRLCFDQCTQHAAITHLGGFLVRLQESDCSYRKQPSNGMCASNMLRVIYCSPGTLREGGRAKKHGDNPISRQAMNVPI